MKDSGLDPTRDMTTRPCFPTISSICSPWEAKYVLLVTFIYIIVTITCQIINQGRFKMFTKIGNIEVAWPSTTYCLRVILPIQWKGSIITPFTITCRRNIYLISLGCQVYQLPLKIAFSRMFLYKQNRKMRTPERVPLNQQIKWLSSTL